MAVRFDGTSGEDFRRTANLPNVNSFTVCGWAKLSVDTNTYATLFSLQDSGGPNYILLTTALDGTTLGIWGPGDGSGTTLQALTVGQWFFWAVTCSGTGANQLISYYATPGATSLTSASRAAGVANYTPTRMSLGDDSFGEPWNGCIERVRVWDAALSTAELLQEMNRTAPARYSNLNIFSPMIASTVALSATDYSGNGRNWTANGTLAVEHGAPVSWGARPIIVPFASAGGSATLAADGGSFTLTGADVTLRRSNTIAADGGTFSLTGADISLEYGRAISAEAGSFTLTGADFAVDLSMAADGGSFALNGSDVTLTYSGGSRTLTVEGGSFAWTGADIALEYNRLIAADSGTFAVNGSDVTLTRNVPMTAGEGAFSVAGADVGFGRTYVLNAENGIFTLGGADVGLVDSGEPQATNQHGFAMQRAGARELPVVDAPILPWQKKRQEHEDPAPLVKALPKRVRRAAKRIAEQAVESVALERRSEAREAAYEAERWQFVDLLARKADQSLVDLYAESLFAQLTREAYEAREAELRRLIQIDAQERLIALDIQRQQEEEALLLLLMME